MNLKNIGKVFTSKFVGTGPTSYKKIITGQRSHKGWGTLLYSLRCSLDRRFGGLQIPSGHHEPEKSMELRSRGCPHRRSVLVRLHCFDCILIKLNWLTSLFFLSCLMRLSVR